MKKIFICLLIFLLVLVSCTTKSVKADKTDVEVVEATVVETPAPAASVDIPVQEPEIQVEPVAEEQTAEVIEILPTEEIIVEGPVVEENPEVAIEIADILAEEDWSQAITGSAPEEEQTVEVELTAKPVSEPTASVSSKATPESTVTAQTSQTQTTAPAKTASASTTAVKTEEKTDSEGLFSKIGHFIANQKLLSIGILTCIIGIVYLIVALFISRRPKKEKKAEEPVQEAENEFSEPDTEPVTDPQAEIEEALRIDFVPEEISMGKPAEKPSDKPSEKPAEQKPEDEDDAFLRSLLGEDKK